ncbi:RxLR effector protein [Phytophthora cinnamomi]|uniref:RxLR effector protein n=1 Tax=Phytophthora cinnamomi TaxID=4785 RepID=UPI003559D6C3|nr:RxLR effector protein [Phytophthora cinnamomi]
MHQRNLLLLVVVAFAACASDVAYAKNAVRATDAVNGDTTHRNLKGNAEIVNAAYAKNAIRATDAVNGDTTHRNLKGNAEIVNAAAAEDEERGIINFKMPGFLTRFFPKNSKISSAVQSSPEVVKAINDPKVGQTIKELEGKKGLIDHLMGLPVVRHIAKRMEGKPLTTNNVKEIGVVVMKSSGRSKNLLEHLWVNHGTGFLFGLGIFFLFWCVYRGMYG